jgi:hypothetical protein
MTALVIFVLAVCGLLGVGMVCGFALGIAHFAAQLNDGGEDDR